MAREKAAAREIEAEFALADAFELARLGRAFETVLDCGLFHTFDEHDERQRYAASLASATSSGGTLYVLCFSDADPAHAGPHPISPDELRAAFNPSGDWEVTAIAPERIEAKLATGGAPAWLATIKRV